MAAMTPEELARYNARRNAAKAQQDANDKRNGQAQTPWLRGSTEPKRTPWLSVTPGLPGRR